MSDNLEESEHQDHEEKEKEEIETVNQTEFCIEILPTIKEAQNQHGLRHGDYQRYRLYCTRRLRRIRKSLHFTSGHRHRYHKKPLTSNIITDQRYLCIPLYSAERAWAMAMELKQASYTEPRKRYHLLRKLRKANKNAKDLLRLCEETGRCDARTKLEVQAYCDWIDGNVQFEQQKWQEALDAFGNSQNIYQKLGGVVSDDQRNMYHQRVDEITPNLRYCAYNIGGMPTDVSELIKLRTNALGSDMLSSKIDEVLAKTGEKTALSLTEVQWQGSTIPIKNEQVRVSLIKLNQTIGEVGKEEKREEKVKLFERLLMECQDAVQTVKEQISLELISEKKRSHKQEQQSSNLKQLIDYLTHVKLVQSIQRNLLLLETLQFSKGSQKTAKPEEFVRVYDILLQHITELNELTQSSDDLLEAKHFTAQTFMFKAFRCYYLSESYTMMKKWVESIGLLERASEHVIQAKEHFREWGKTEAESDLLKLQQLQETIRGKKCELQVHSIIESQGLEEQMSELNLHEKPLTESLDTFNPSISSRNITLAPVPPEYKPLPGKPLFFDLALDHVEFPSLAHRVEKKGGGLTGFVKGLFWGRS